MFHQCCAICLWQTGSRGVLMCAGTSRKMWRRAGDTFFDAPAALPARGSIPSVSALDPEVAAARQQLAEEAENAHLIHNGESTSSPPVPAEVLVQCTCSLAFIARPDAHWVCPNCQDDHGAWLTLVHDYNLRTCLSCTFHLCIHLRWLYMCTQM